MEGYVTALSEFLDALQDLAVRWSAEAGPKVPLRPDS